MISESWGFTINKSRKLFKIGNKVEKQTVSFDISKVIS